MNLDPLSQISPGGSRIEDREVDRTNERFFAIRVIWTLTNIFGKQFELISYCFIAYNVRTCTSMPFLSSQCLCFAMPPKFEI